MVVLLAAVLTPAPTIGAQNPSPNPDDTSAAVPFIGERQTWCTERNPGFDGFCRNRNHHSSPAIDFGLPIGATLRSTGSGTVIEADSFCSGSGSCNNGAGNIVVIEHPDGRFSRYLHMDDVSVSVGQDVVTGQVLGTNGNTGHFSSPHLHFDEQFPLGTRINAGTMVGCVDGEKVNYPAAFGVNDWADVPFGSVIVNEDYSCFTGAAAQPLPAPSTGEPRVFAGSDRFGIAPPVGSADSLYEISLNTSDRNEPVVFQMTAGALRRFPVLSGVAEVRARELINGAPQAWSDTVQFTPTSTQEGPTCGGLYASQSSLSGTPQADVLIGTSGNDAINGGGGNDIICSLGGADVVSGGAGADLILGGSGKDAISGNQGKDDLRGGRGQDSLIGGRGGDSLSGGNGNDSLVGARGIDEFDGGSGIDRCEQGESADETHVGCEQ